MGMLAFRNFNGAGFGSAMPPDIHYGGTIRWRLSVAATATTFEGTPCCERGEEAQEIMRRGNLTTIEEKTTCAECRRILGRRIK